MSLTVLGFFFTALTMCLSSTADIFLGPQAQRLLFNTPEVSVFFRTFQMVVLAIINVCAMALVDFPSSLSFRVACFSPLDSSLIFMLVTPFKL